MNIAKKAFRRGFTLVELLVAMAITAILVSFIMQLTHHGISLWQSIQHDISTTGRSRMALQTIAHDLESFQMGTGSDKYQWFLSEVDERQTGAGVSGKLRIPNSVKCIFFACAPDRNPSVSSSTSLRGNYRQARASNPETQGDVNAIGYRLMYHDHILNLNSASTEAFPIFSLYRQVIQPRETYENILGKTDLAAAYRSYEQNDEQNFLCENILEMTLLFNIEYCDDSSKTKNGEVMFSKASIPVISSRGNSSAMKVYSDRIEAGGKVYKNGRIVSANISMTVLTEEGVNLVEQIRKGNRRAPKSTAFFARYTRSFARVVLMPQPL